jgi:hypothetical protein
LRDRWQVVQAGASSAHARDCNRIAVVLVNDSPAEDLCSALPTVDAYCLATYARTEFEATLAQVLEARACASELGQLSESFRLERDRTRTAIAHGRIRIADGRSDPAFFGGQPRLLRDFKRWKLSGEHADVPIQLRRLRELESLGVDVVELPMSSVVEAQAARIKLAQPIVICQNRFRAAEAHGRVTVRWS